MSKPNKIVDKNDIRVVTKVLLNNWYIILFFPMLAAAFAYFYTYRMVDVYGATTQIMLQSDQGPSLNLGMGQGLGGRSSFQQYDKTQSQIRVITSGDIIGSTLDRLNSDVSYFIQGRLKKTEIHRNMPFKVVSEYFPASTINREMTWNIVDTGRYKLTYIVNDEVVENIYKFGEQVLDDGLFFKIEKAGDISGARLETLQFVTYLFNINRRSSLVKKYKSRLSVKSLDWTTVLELTLEDEVPERAIAFLDTLTAIFGDKSVENEILINENTIRYINAQINSLTEVLGAIEDEIEGFKEEKSILDLTREQSELFAKLVETEESLRTLELQKDELKEIKAYVAGYHVDDIVPPPMAALNSDQSLVKLLERLYVLTLQRKDVIKQGHTAKAMSVEVAKADIEDQRKVVYGYLENLDQDIKGKIDIANLQIAQFEQTLKVIPRNERTLINIERRLQVNENIYTYLLEKRAETQIARAGILSSVQVVERPRSIGVVRPNKEKIIISMTAIGILIALVIVLIRHLLYDKIENAVEMATVTDMPVLGSVPFNPDIPEDGIVVQQGKSQLAETYRALRTNLQYVMGQGEQLIMVTSVYPGEGKTFCSTNLSGIFSLADKKVLLLDFDLHKPKVHKMFNFKNDIGVSNLLIGTAEYEDVIKKSHVPNLDVIVCGPIPPNSSELILSPKVQELIKWAKANYELVVFDTPPMGLISDAHVLMKSADVSVFIMNVKMAKRQSVRFIEDIVAKSEIKNYGLVLNGVRRKPWQYYYGKYSYKYGGRYAYGYGYGYGPAYGEEGDDD